MIIPRVGDIWEFKLPGKRKRVKEIGRIYFIWMQKQDDTNMRRLFIEWYRLPKGRYSGIRPRVLLKYGRRISTKAERDAHSQAPVAARKVKVKEREIQ